MTTHRTGTHHTDEAKQKISAARVGKAAGVNHYRYGKKLSAEVREKIAATQRGVKKAPRILSPEGRAKIAAAAAAGHYASFAGKAHTAEAREKMSRAVVAFLPDGSTVRYSGLSALRDAVGTSIATIIRACKSRGIPLVKGPCAGWVLWYEGEQPEENCPRTPLQDFYSRAIEAHQGRYTYPVKDFQSMHHKVSVVCPDHGAFTIKASKHLHAGQGCAVCGKALCGIRNDVQGSAMKAAQSKIRSYAEGFIARAEAVHGSKYDYTHTQYHGAKKKVLIGCPKHGQFSQGAWDHTVKAHGCPRCGNTQSKQETRIAEYLSMFTPTVSRDRTILKPKELDIYLPEKKLAIEYCGMYWHSHFNAEDNRTGKNKHFQKYQLCAEQGIRLLTIYEAEWEEREPAIRRLLRNAVGKGRGKLMARKCELRKVATAEARVFYEKYHPQGGAGSGEHYGLYWKSKLVACMRFSFGQNDRGTGAAKRTWTLGRYATRVTVAGAASRLFKAFVQEHNPPEVKSFSDNRYFSGGMYTQLGFTLEQDVTPDYQVWSPKTGLRPKSHYQRRQLPQRLLEHEVVDTFIPETDPRTESDMTYLMGCGRIYDCGKKRWVWRVAPQGKTE
jgi:NUMOD3 motif/Protein of unknown function (DUF723)